jgi:hypothetical protein
MCFSCVGTTGGISYPVTTSIEILLWCKASYVWSFNNLIFSSLSQIVCAVWLMYTILELAQVSDQLNRFYLKMETESSPRIFVF